MKQEIGIYDRWIESLEQHPSLSSSAQFALQDFIRDRDVLAIEREFYSSLLQALEDIKRNEIPQETNNKQRPKPGQEMENVAENKMGSYMSQESRDDDSINTQRRHEPESVILQFSL